MVKGVLCLCLIASVVAVALAVPIRTAECRSNGCCRLEILYSGSWGTVCGDGWGDPETRVACRQLGCGGSNGWMTFDGGSGNIWMDGVNCGGSEESLESCSFRGWGTHGCSHSEDVGVCCSGCGAGSSGGSSSSTPAGSTACKTVCVRYIRDNSYK
jgi:hypothetical protein